MAVTRSAPPAPAAATQQHPHSRLGGLIASKIEMPPRIMVHGEGGLGKSTFGATAPRPIFIDSQNGSNEVEVARYPFADGRFHPESLAEVIDALDDIQRSQHEFKTLVIDTLESIEPLIWAEVVRRDPSAVTLEDVGGGFGKGVKAAVDEWRRLLKAIEQVWLRRRMTVILIDHTEVVKFKNASGEDYGRFAPKIHGLAAGLFHGWVDATLYVELESYTKPKALDKKKHLGVSSDRRIMHTVKTAQWVAKNRYYLPPILPLDWGEFERAVEEGPRLRVAALREEIETAIANAEPDFAAKVRGTVADAKEDGQKLTRILNRVMDRLGVPASAGAAAGG